MAFGCGYSRRGCLECFHSTILRRWKLCERLAGQLVDVLPNLQSACSESPLEIINKSENYSSLHLSVTSASQILMTKFCLNASSVG